MQEKHPEAVASMESLLNRKDTTQLEAIATVQNGIKLFERKIASIPAKIEKDDLLDLHLTYIAFHDHQLQYSEKCIYIYMQVTKPPVI